MKIDTARYAECATIAELAEKLKVDLAPVAATMGLLRNRVLVASYIRPEKTAGGIIRPDQVREEDKWQGKAGIVLAMGPIAFNFEEVVEYANDLQVVSSTSMIDRLAEARRAHDVPDVGDWVFFRNSDAWDSALQIAPGVGAHCRFIFDSDIIGRIDDPSAIW